MIMILNSALQVLRILMGINVRVLFILLLLSLGAIFYIGARTSGIIVFVFTVCIFSFLLALYLTKWVLAKDEGPPEMAEVCTLDISFFDNRIAAILFVVPEELFGQVQIVFLIPFIILWEYIFFLGNLKITPSLD